MSYSEKVIDHYKEPRAELNKKRSGDACLANSLVSYLISLKLVMS